MGFTAPKMEPRVVKYEDMTNDQLKGSRRLKMNLEKLRAVIDFVPHHMQKQVLLNKSRFKTLCWGRRCGKTLLISYYALKYLLTARPDMRGHNIWIVAPTYDLARRSWDYLMMWIPFINKAVGNVIKVDKTNHTMKSIFGSRLELKSADNPASLLGIGLDLLIIDEAARVPESIWQVNLRPTLTDRLGKAIFISTPYGKNWFYDMMLKGISTDPIHADYAYFHMKTRDNKTLPDIENEVEKAKMEMPVNDFMQEYEAEFIDGAGSVFRNVRECIYPCNFTGFPFMAENYSPDKLYQGGLDLARLTDFTVATMVERAQEQIKVSAIDRFNELDWKLQKPRLALFSEKFRNPRIHTERNGIGDGVLEDLPGNFDPFTTTNESKKDLINYLSILFEQKKILIPNIPALIHELESFSYEITSNGRIKYGAPPGLHDDMVMSLALAVKDATLVPSQSLIKPKILVMETAVQQEEY